jgi:hypothetical protein
MGKHVSQSTRTVKDKLDNRLPKERKHRVERRGFGTSHWRGRLELSAEQENCVVVGIGYPASALR